ncbi:MAG: glycosyltransferase [Cyclobacteriaceae bacterium]
MKKKILLLVPDVNVGGVGRVISNISKLLSEKYNFTVCIFDLSNSFYEIDGSVIDLGIKNGNNPVSYFVAQLRRLYKVHQLKRKLDFDLSISFITSAHYINCLSRHKEKIVLSLRNPFTHDYLHRNLAKYIGNSSLATKIKIRVFSLADIIIPNSKRGLLDIDEFEVFKKAEIQLDYIQNFVDIKKVEAQAKEPLDDEVDILFEKHRIILNVARLYEQKGIDTLLSVYANYRKPNKRNAKLVIIGDGVRRADLIERAKLLGLKVYHIWEENQFDDSYDVYFLGTKKNPYQFMSRATIFLFPTRFEGFPNTIIESMACKLPVLCSDCVSGPREILLPDTDLRSDANSAELGQGGILLPLILSENKNLEAIWAASLNELLDNEELRMSLSARAYRRSHDFSKDRIFEKWSSLIEAAI